MYLVVEFVMSSDNSKNADDKSNRNWYRRKSLLP